MTEFLLINDVVKASIVIVFFIPPPSDTKLIPVIKHFVSKITLWMMTEKKKEINVLDFT